MPRGPKGCTCAAPQCPDQMPCRLAPSPWGADGRVVHSIRNGHSNLAPLHRLSGRNQQSQRDCKLTFRGAIPSIRYFVVGSCLLETNKISTFGPMVFFSSGTLMAPGPPDATNT